MQFTDDELKIIEEALDHYDAYPQRARFGEDLRSRGVRGPQGTPPTCPRWRARKMSGCHNFETGGVPASQY